MFLELFKWTELRLGGNEENLELVLSVRLKDPQIHTVTSGQAMLDVNVAICRYRPSLPSSPSRMSKSSGLNTRIWSTTSSSGSWTEEPGGLQSTGSQGVRHDWATKHSTFMVATCVKDLLAPTGNFKQLDDRKIPYWNVHCFLHLFNLYHFPLST